MAFLSIIRRWHKRDHVPIREISRRLGVSRNTIRKYLRSDLIEPRFQVPDRPSKLDPYAEKLAPWLRREGSRPRKQRRTVKQLYGDLVSLGYDGSYNRVAAGQLGAEQAAFRRDEIVPEARLPVFDCHVRSPPVSGSPRQVGARGVLLSSSVTRRDCQVGKCGIHDNHSV